MNYLSIMYLYIFDNPSYMPESIQTQPNLARIKECVDSTIREIGYFNLIDPRVVPEGLKLIARSVSWLIEQVMVQHLRANRIRYGLEEVIDPPTNVNQYDCILKFTGDDIHYYVNFKASLVQTDDSGRFDISKASRLIEFYENDPSRYLLISIIKIELAGTGIRLVNSKIFNVAWIGDIYYNRANHNLQTRSDGESIIRSNVEFVNILKDKISDRGHSLHY